MATILHYFDLRGFGEYIRLLFIDQKIEFIDHRLVQQSEEWEELKKTMPFGQLPCLEAFGNRLVQTGSILRYLARKFDLNGSNENEEIFLDQFFEALRDSRMKHVRYIYKDEYSRDQMENEVLPTSLQQIQNFFETFENGNQFVLGGKISYVDYVLFEELDVYLTQKSTILENFPKLKKFHERMSERQNLLEYLKKRKENNVWIYAVPRNQ